MEPYDQRSLLRQRMVGSRFRLPDIQEMMREWPFAVNPDFHSLKIEVTERLESMLPPSKRLDHLKAADAAFFAACWWPYASPERLRAATWLSIWLFAWDDEMDSVDISLISHALGSARRFREETRAFLRRALGISATVECTQIPHVINALFLPAAQSICKGYPLRKRKGLMEELDFFIDQTAQEQTIAMSANLPSREAYMARRMGSSAVGVCLAISEYAFELELPKFALEHEAMSALWEQTNIIISVANDILSISKELKQGQVDSLIPVLFAEAGDLQKAVDEAASMIDEAIVHFDKAAEVLKGLALAQILPKHDYPAYTVEAFVRSCQYACTANLHWSLVSGRYGLACHTLQEGVDIIV